MFLKHIKWDWFSLLFHGGIRRTARLYLVVNVLQIFLLDNLGVPFWATTFCVIINDFIVHV